MDASLKEMNINLKPGSTPQYNKPYTYTPAIRKEISAQVHQLLKLGIIRHSQSDWEAPVVLTDKPDGSK